jgi:hypothetical protein
MSLESFAVQATRACRLPGDQDERWDILSDRRPHGREAVHADSAELVHQGKAAQNGMVPDGNVAGERCVVGHDDIVPDLAIVGNVYVGHNPVVAADPGDTTAVLRTAIEGAIFSYRVAVTYLQ